MSHYIYLLAITSENPTALNRTREDFITTATDGVTVYSLGASQSTIIENINKMNLAQTAFNRKKRDEAQVSFTFPTNDESKTTHKGK